MSTESQFWSFLQPRLTPFGRAVRFETPGALGTPDVYYNFRGGKSGWVELKHLEELPAPKNLLVHDKLKIEQVNWLRDEHLAGGRAFLLIRADRTILLLSPMEAEAMFYHTLTVADALARAGYVARVNDFKPIELIRCLIR